MPGPWLDIKGNLGYFMENPPNVGDFLEVQLYEDDFKTLQGTGIGHVLEERTFEERIVVKLHLVVVSDGYYHHYLFDEDGGGANPWWYWLGPKDPPRRLTFEGKQPHFCGRYRTLAVGELGKDHVSWLGPVCTRKVTQYLRNAGLAEVSDTHAPVRGALHTASVRDADRGASVRDASRPVLFGSVGLPVDDGRDEL